jgi:hypothetical protein
LAEYPPAAPDGFGGQKRSHADCEGLEVEVLWISIHAVGQTRKCNQFRRLGDRRVTEIAEFENIREHLRGRFAKQEARDR